MKLQAVVGMFLSERVPKDSHQASMVSPTNGLGFNASIRELGLRGHGLGPLATSSSVKEVAHGG